MGKLYQIAVVGAGIVGLSTAVCIQELLPSAQITIIADKILSDTVSDGSGGIFRPEITIDPEEKNTLKWCEDSLKHFSELSSSTHSGEAGIQMVSGYHLYSSGSPMLLQNTLLKQLVPLYRNLTPKELKCFPPEFKYGIFYTTFITDCRYYLPWLTKRFEHAGGKIEVKHVEKLSDISDDFDIIVNCSGLGAKQLMKDKFLVPIRGQTIKVKAPWIKHFYYGDGVYVIPGVDYVTLGGIKDYGDWSIKVNQFQKKYIWEKCIKLVPSLQKSKVMWDWVGLRPHRSSVCLDSSIMECNGKLFKVVNNYGHGGHGVALSWGTAKDAATRVKEMLTSSFLIAKL